MMLPEVKTKWLAALRGGGFKQGQERLHNTDNDTHCCLGVLAKLQYGNAYAGWVAGPENERLSEQQRAELGIMDAQQAYLIGMNDGYTPEGAADEDLIKSFSEIADWVEENL